MTKAVHVIVGPAGSGKTERLLAGYRKALTLDGVSRALWLAPTRRAVAAVRDSLLAGDLAACFSPNCRTFADFAQMVVGASPLDMRPLTPVMQRRLLRRTINEVQANDGLTYFEPIAETAGMLDLLGGFISELKRLEIWPEHFLSACKRRGLSLKDQELHRLYHHYQQLLTQHQLYDREGKFWSAREMLASGQRRPWEKLSQVFVDGFTDFTRTEYEILQILAERVESMTLTLPLEEGDARRDLFAKPRLSLDELRRRFPALRVESLGRRTSAAWPAMAHVEAHLFGNPRTVPQASDTEGIEIIATAGQTGEIEAIAGRIKQLLTHGDSQIANQVVRPGEILVVLRSLGESAALVREVFARWGIPVSITAPARLDRAGVFSALMTLLRLKLEDWPFRPLLAFLTNNYFQPNWQDSGGAAGRQAAEYVVRQSQIPAGRAELLKLAHYWESQLEPATQADPTQTEPAAERRSARQRKRSELAALAMPLLNRLDAALAALPKRAPPGRWAKALEKLAAEVGLRESTTGASTSADELAWNRMIESITSLDQLSSWLAEEPPSLTLNELVEQLTDVLRYEQLPLDHDEAGRVRVLDAPNARNISAPYVFLADVSEKAFPPAEREDRMYSEAETRRLMAAGLPLIARAQRSSDEMLLFYEVLTRPIRRLYLSYSALDSKGQALSPSPYLTEIERACGTPGRIARSVDADLTPVPRSADLFCERDLRVKAVADALDGDGSLLAGLRQQDGRSAKARQIVSDNIVAALGAIDARGPMTGFGRFEGMFQSAAARARLAERFGPEHHWSTSRLEQYANCPYQFLLERVLHLEELADLTLDVDYMLRGRAMHATLAMLHKQLNQQAGGPTSPCGQADEEMLREGSTILEKFFGDLRRGQPVEDSMREVDRRRVAGWMAGYPKQHRDYDAGWSECETPLVPTYFEVSFGPPSQGELDNADLETQAADSLSTAKAFELKCGSETVRLVGRIDRIDIGTVGGRQVFNIVDYKSGSTNARLSAKAVAEGRALQLPLYALAVQELLLADQQAIPWRAAYWYVQGNGYKEILAFHGSSEKGVDVLPSWSELRPQLELRVGALIHSIRSGQFPMASADEECTSRCAFSTVCRVNQVRALKSKTWQAESPE